MKKWLISFVLVFALSFSLSVSAFAVDDNNFYSLPPVGSADSSLAIHWPVSTFSDQQLASIIDILGNISKQITVVQSNQSVLGQMISKLSGIVTNIGNTLIDIHSSMGVYQTILTSIFDKVASEASLSSFKQYFSDSPFVVSNTSTLSGLNSFLGWVFDMRPNGQFSDSPKPYTFEFYDPASASYKSGVFSWGVLLSGLYGNSSLDGMLYADDGGYRYTLYHYVKNLSETLASEEDKHLSQNQKDNLQQIGNDFLSGESGNTSLGKGDFSNASQVGAALNDTFNMGGAAKVSDFLSGFGSAGSQSQAWFSQTTANNLNAVEAVDGTQGVSTFVDDGETMVDFDPDPYNMADIFGRYDWLEGVIVDD